MTSCSPATWSSSTARSATSGIYIGNGQMVHAPSSGDVVKVAPLMSGFSGARRIAR